ncbi:sugar transferase [Planktotalea arctica]|uniref:sugar transferase n=1 Tax=Planktotalea arctica TaxID=1481893 RepID=UPI00321B31DD
MREFIKRSFDLLGAIVGLAVFWWLIAICWIIASVDTQSNGMFTQKRIGRHGKPFSIYKVKTMRNPISAERSSITVAGTAEITKSGRTMRRLKLDELPQFWNVLCGHMSFVGPRPDVAGYADLLTGEDRIILSVRPGITGPASLQFRNEEELLFRQEDPIAYNQDVIWPKKVAINRVYAETYGFRGDIKYILQTIGFKQ